MKQDAQMQNVISVGEFGSVPDGELGIILHGLGKCLDGEPREAVGGVGCV